MLSFLAFSQERFQVLDFVFKLHLFPIYNLGFFNALVLGQDVFVVFDLEVQLVLGFFLSQTQEQFT